MDRTENLIDKNNKETMLPIFAARSISSRIDMRKRDLVVKSRRPHLIRTIDGTSLPWDIREPKSALQTFRSRRDGAIPLRRPHLADRPPSNPSEPHKACSAASRQAVNNFREDARARLAECDVYRFSRTASLWSSFTIGIFNVIDIQGESSTLISSFLLPFAVRKRSTLK